MTHRRLRCLLFVLIAPMAVSDHAAAQPVKAQTASASTQVRTALDQLDAWLGGSANGNRWREYLDLAALRDQIDKGVAADPDEVSRALVRFSSRARGLDLSPFNHVRQALRAWLAEVRLNYGDDFAKLAASVRGEYTPLSNEQFAQIRAEMRNRANDLMAWLGGNSPLAQRWKKYLRWELLEPHFRDDMRVTRRSLENLDQVLLRFHANEPGLELPRFVETAKAIARYRALASWAPTRATRDSRAYYEELLTRLGDELQRHLQRPTTETAWKIGRVLGVVDVLGHSRDFVTSIRQRFARPNIRGLVSANVIRHMPNRPVNQVRDVRDCILGTSIFGKACTLGNVEYQLVPSENSVELAIHLTGTANSNTNGYNGPVRIHSTGLTNFAAYKQISITDAGFIAQPAVADAQTHTNIRSITKTGGNFGRNLIEKIAWRRAMEQKSQAEAISSQHTEQRVIREFNDLVARDLGDLRQRYEQKIRNPLIRRAVSPEYLRMHSTPEGVEIASTFAARNQLAANSPAPAAEPGYDLVLQIHESAVNNYLPLALARAKISQQSAENPPSLDGDVPNWIKLMSVARPKLAAAVATGAEVVEEAGEAIQEAVQGQQDENDERRLPPFKPYSITLNAEAPASVHFDDGKAVVRIRASTLASDDAEYQNWDFLVTYQLATRDDRIVLKRTGDIEVFPTGFDPAWDKQLTAQQSGFRSTLAKNMNARAKAGQSFPDEIPIEPIHFTRFGALLLHELKADDGWLTVSWILPPAPASPPSTLPPATIPPRSG